MTLPKTLATAALLILAGSAPAAFANSYEQDRLEAEKRHREMHREYDKVVMEARRELHKKHEELQQEARKRDDERHLEQHKREAEYWRDDY